MANTEFYRKARYDSSKITWKDIFSDSFRKHTRQERDYAMAVGTSMRPVNEATMLQTWRKPWLWFYYGKFGAAIILLLIIAYKISSDFLIFHVMLYCIPPLVVPMIIMIFLWELNIPQNISIMELFVYFLVGGVVSLVITDMLYVCIPSGPAFLAAFREEPAKLICGLFFLWYFAKKKGKKIFGVTGLAIGGAVGAGFSGFESIQYTFYNGFQTEILRAITAPGGHMLYCAPYVAAFALAVHKNRSFSWKCLLDKSFLAAFAIGMVFHAAWNSLGSLGLGAFGNCFMIVVIIILLWVHLLYWVRKCLNEVVGGNAYSSHAGASPYGQRYSTPIAAQQRAYAGSVTGKLKLECIAGSQAGKKWSSTGAPITIGRDSGCAITITGDSRGVSRKHCSIRKTPRGWEVKDLNSSYGTYISGRKLARGGETMLHGGEVLYLGSKLVGFRVTVQ